MNYKIDHGVAFKDNIFLIFDSGFRLLVYKPSTGFRKRIDLGSVRFGSGRVEYKYCYDNYDTIVEEVKRFLVKEML